MSKAHSAIDVQMGSHESGQPRPGTPDMKESSTQAQADTEAEADADKKNSFHLSVEDSGQLGGYSPEEAAAQDPAEQEEWEDDDDEESEGQPVCVFYISINYIYVIRIKVKHVFFSKIFRSPQQDSSICPTEKGNFSP